MEQETVYIRCELMYNHKVKSGFYGGLFAGPPFLCAAVNGRRRFSTQRSLCEQIRLRMNRRRIKW